ncbi:hypothetical protein ACSVIJ_07825 [Pseudomonas sp. NCHU5208]|uniref:hypothetical protein n=1 Tax=unclassified Pseudomonas TaxID=196821 RepID=UPI003F945416
MDKERLSSLVVGFWLIASASSSYSASLVCSGKVEALSYHANNQFMIKLSSMNVPVFFCSPEREWVVAGTGYKTGAETCKAFYSTFLAARMSGEPINNLFFDGDQVPAACDAWSNWQSANIRHFIY